VRGLCPGPALVGTARVPGSKSIAQRALLAAALARGTTRFGPLPAGDDVRAAAALAGHLARGDLRRGAPAALHAGESGTLARFALAVLGLGAAGPGRFALEVAGSLRRRHSAPLLAALRAAGARIEGPREGADADGSWPLVVEPPAAAPARVRLEAPVSSQEASGLCLALAALGGRRELAIAGRLPSRPYLDMTLAVLGDFGARCEARGLGGDAGRVLVRGPLAAPATYAFEPDASLAAVALAAGLVSGGRVEVEGLPERSLQGDACAVAHFSALGFAAGRAGGRLFAGGARAAPGAGAPEVALDLSATPDLAPVLVALAAAARPGRATFTGLETLEGKESARLTGLARGLAALGLEVEAGPGRLSLARPALLPAGPLRLDCAGDHRMAFAWSLVGLAREGLELRGAECVSKSWPGFFDELERLGARVAR